MAEDKVQIAFTGTESYRAKIQRLALDRKMKVQQFLETAVQLMEQGEPRPDTGQTATAPQYSYRLENQRLHDMLEEVLNSGDELTIRAVVPNIEIFHARLQPRPMHGRRRAG